MTRYVLHVDLDQFIAAVELLRRPELQGKPIVVGGAGDPTKRGVVATASYEARAFGVGSGMPLRLAARKCPEAVFLPVDFPAYRAASETVMATLRSFPAVLEVTGWDEAFLEVETEDAEAFAREIRRAVLGATGLSCSVGVGENKLQAKVASALAKPAGVFSLTSDRWSEVMGDRPPDALWGIGRKRRRQLVAMGIETVGELAAADEEVLGAAFGPRTGPWLRRLGRGADPSPVRPRRPAARSRGRETTFQEDLEGAERIRGEIRRLAARVAEDLRDEGRPAVRVVVKVRFAPFDTRTHGVALPSPASGAPALQRAALEALEGFGLDRPVRLLGVRAELARPGEAG